MGIGGRVPRRVDAATKTSLLEAEFPHLLKIKEPAVLRGEVTTAEAAAAAGVDRTTVVRIRQVAKDGALAALAESRPGIKAGGRDVELDAAKAEIARLSETVKEMAVKLMLVEGEGGWG